MTKDIRWIQRFSNYVKALIELGEAVKLSKTRTLSKLEKQGLIQCFEYTYELAWKTLKDFLENQGVIDLFGAKETIREAFKSGLIINGEIWMQMIKSHNQTSHLYDEKISEEIAKTVIESYFYNFLLLNEELAKLQKKAESL
ncbi:MAG: nucleotidyltransferase substrate binding protein [Verrucomicrobia bacterium]|nr:nucleotidyltransferase substrate binding protein [Verrucomicrobiota bacterium]